ncbi:bacterio-opsin activator domain-containing protein [Halorientalis pallida]|uniref:helix-turn-helix domain-containing protein n=1 Tax=Halorientalis pallida TaxID=2479928 RepID=UPI003C705B37
MSGNASVQQGHAVVEVEFSVRNASYPFVSVTDAESCVFELAEMVPRGDGEYAEFFNVSGIDPDRIVSLAADREALDVSLLESYDQGGMFEFVAGADCPAVQLAELGALPREATAVDGEGRIVAEIPPRFESAAVVETFLDATSDIELVSKRGKESFSPLFSESAFRQVLETELTERQREVLRAAYDAGYYEWPQECTGADVADDLGITSATFSEHIHAAERKLLGLLFDTGAGS